MNIHVSDEALAFLAQKQENYIRIVARDTYECSTMIEFYLSHEHTITNEDVVVKYEDVQLVYNKKASDEIGSHLTIDYLPSQGLKLINHNQTLAYGLVLR